VYSSTVTLSSEIISDFSTSFLLWSNSLISAYVLLHLVKVKKQFILSHVAPIEIS